MLKILLVEGNTAYQKAILKFIEKEVLFVNFEIIETFNELKRVNLSDYDLAITDYILPDSQNEEHINFLIGKINTIILTKRQVEENNPSIKEKFLDSVLDYIYKDDLNTYRYIAQIVKRYNKNKNLNVLVVDDSKVIRKQVKKYLELFNLKVVEAEDGKKAKEIITKKDISLLITDVYMPIMDGFDLIKAIRKEKSIEELPILAISGASVKEESIKMLKIGANDFIKKPFLKEELLIRVSNLLNLYDYINQYKQKSEIDPLTKAYNRSILESKIDSLFHIYDKKTIVMLDIDFFKKINDTYGHQIGDKVLKHFASHIKNSIRKNDFLIRYGGEEFLIFLPNTTKTEAYIIMHKIKNTLTQVEGIKYSFSAGIADEGETLAEMIKIADERLYKAKKEGRNRIVFK